MTHVYVVIAESSAVGRKIVDDYRRMALHTSGVTFVTITAPDYELERPLSPERIAELLSEHLHCQYATTRMSWLFLTTVLLIQEGSQEYYRVVRDKRGLSDNHIKIGDPVHPAIVEYQKELIERPPQKGRSALTIPLNAMSAAVRGLSPDSVFVTTEDFVMNVGSMHVNFKEWLAGVYSNLLSYKTQACLDFKTIGNDDHLALTITCLREIVGQSSLTMTPVPGSETAFLFERKADDGR